MESTLKKPPWLKIRPSFSTDFSLMKASLRKRGLVTVCEEAQCPNMAECWHDEGTVTFMVMGDTCTRGCKFCAIKTAFKGTPLDPKEPENIAQAVAEMKLTYVVLTSVDRDDLDDQGSTHFAKCITAIRAAHHDTFIEVLIPDFQGRKDLLKNIVDAKPDVIAHNVETVERLQRKVRDPRASFNQSLSVLRMCKELDASIFTKSSIMVGLGEQHEEVEQTMQSLRDVDCDVVTLGQYLKPREKFLAVEEYVHPDRFKHYRSTGERMGFLYVAAGPFVRSSYRAGELFLRSILQRKRAAEQPEVIVSHET